MSGSVHGDKLNLRGKQNLIACSLPLHLLGSPDWLEHQLIVLQPHSNWLVFSQLSVSHWLNM